MSTLNEARLAKRPYVAECPFTPINTKPVSCALETCNGCHIVAEFNRKEAIGLCPACGAHLENWKEVFGEKHSCQGGVKC